MKLPISLGAVLTLIVAHAAITFVAGAFGFVSILGVREALRALLGAVWFDRLSSAVQASLVVFLATIFLLLPGVSFDVTHTWLVPNEVWTEVAVRS